MALEFRSSTDQHPVIFGSDGLPLTTGSYLRYQSIGTTDLKSIYSDEDRTVPADNPVDIGNDGRTIIQVFLGAGQYTVSAYKYNGDGIDFSDPADWSLDNEWNEQGLTSAVPVPDTAVTIETIDELRTVLSSTATTALLTGYYADGDKPAIVYTWDSTSLAADDSGYTIRNSEATGAWIHKPAELVDVRDYGIITDLGGASTYARITAAESYSATNGKKLYWPFQNVAIPAGVSSISVTNSVMDSRATFTCADECVISFGGSFQRSGTNPIAADTNTKVQFTANTAEEIELGWLGSGALTLDTVDFFTTVGASRPVVIRGTCSPAITQNLTIANPLAFRDGGYLQNDTAYTITFGAPFINENEGLKILGASTSKFSYYQNTFRTSWVAAGATETAAIQAYITAMPASATVIYDHPVTVFTGSPDFNYREHIVERGTLRNDGAGDVTLLGSFRGVYGCLTQDTWVLPSDFDMKWVSTDLVKAITICAKSRLPLDLQGQSYSCTAGATLTGSYRHIAIKNGRITPTGSYALVNLTGSADAVEFSSLEVDTSGNPVTMVAVAGSLTSLYMTDSAISTTASLATCSGTVGVAQISGISGSGDVTLPDGCAATIRGCNLSGSALDLPTGSILTANRLLGTSVTIRNDGETLNGKASANTFITTDIGAPAYIEITTDTADTFVDLLITDNTYDFPGATDFVEAHRSSTTGSGTWRNLQHNIVIKDNVEGTGYVVKQTSDYFNTATVVSIGSAFREGAIVPIDQFFVLYNDAAQPCGFPKYCHWDYRTSTLTFTNALYQVAMDPAYYEDGGVWYIRTVINDNTALTSLDVAGWVEL
jgi:hypothetical protein